MNSGLGIGFLRLFSRTLIPTIISRIVGAKGPSPLRQTLVPVGLILCSLQTLFWNEVTS